MTADGNMQRDVGTAVWRIMPDFFVRVKRKQARSINCISQFLKWHPLFVLRAGN
jgi:hypothetical protein